MPRPIWSGSVTFGLVNIPVKLYGAVAPKEVRFHMLHDADGARIREKRVCSADGEEVPYEHTLKGYEVSPHHYVALTRDELAAFEPPSTRNIEIQDFVDLDEIDPIFYDHSYYLLPDKGAAKAYALLLDALRRSGKVGIARVVLRSKQSLCALRPLGDTLTMTTMLYADEIVPASTLEGLPEREVKPSERELRVAEQLVESLSGKFDPAKYKDDHRERVLGLIERKAEGEQIVAPEEERPPAKVVSLIDALEASLAAAQKRGGGRGERKREEPGGRKARHKRTSA